MNPSTKKAVVSRIKALIMRVNKPRLKRLIGKVKIINMGFIKVLKIPKTMAVIMRDSVFKNQIESKSLSTNHKAEVLIINRIIRLFKNVPCLP